MSRFNQIIIAIGLLTGVQAFALNVTDILQAKNIYQSNQQIQMSLDAALSETGESVSEELVTKGPIDLSNISQQEKQALQDQADLILAMEAQKCIVYRTRFGVESYCQNVAQ